MTFRQSHDPQPSSSSSTMHLNEASGSHTKDVLNDIVSGRKSWKTSRGGEPVWPPALEAALLEGLKEYTPDDSRETRLLGRFRLRNRFISDYILRTTGKVRSAKQVGSRLQQLRESYTGKDLQKLLTPCKSTRPRPHRGGGDLVADNDFGVAGSSSSSMLTSPIDPPDTSTGGAPPVNWIDISPDVDVAPYPGSPTTPAPAEHRTLRNVDPTLTFVHADGLAATSRFLVLCNNMVVHGESTELTRADVPPQRRHEIGPGQSLYATPLVPRFWETLCESIDPTVYTIQQEVHDSQTGTQIFAAVWAFRFHADASVGPSTTGGWHGDFRSQQQQSPAQSQPQSHLGPYPADTHATRAEHQQHGQEDGMFLDSHSNAHFAAPLSPLTPTSSIGGEAYSFRDSELELELGSNLDFDLDSDMFNLDFDLVGTGVPSLFVSPPDVVDFLSSSESSDGSSYASSDGDHRSPQSSFSASDSEEGIVTSPTSACFPSSISYYLS